MGTLREEREKEKKTCVISPIRTKRTETKSRTVYKRGRCLPILGKAVAADKVFQQKNLEL